MEYVTAVSWFAAVQVGLLLFGVVFFHRFLVRFQVAARTAPWEVCREEHPARTLVVATRIVRVYPWRLAVDQLFVGSVRRDARNYDDVVEELLEEARDRVAQLSGSLGR